MSHENPAPVAGAINGQSASIHPALAESHGSVVNGGTSLPAGLPAVNGPETAFADHDMSIAAGVLHAAGVLSTVI
jgi:hypothetical protein